MKLALVADWLTAIGGAERVLEQFHALWPAAPIFTTVARPKSLGSLRDAHIHVTKLQNLFRIMNDHRLLLPWMAPAIETVDLRGYDVILSSSHAVGKGIIPPSDAVHICYCHTPVRYAWEMEQQYLEDFHIPRGLQGKVRRTLRELRRWDLTSAKRVDHFIANSQTVQERIKRIYNRESIVIHPPVANRFLTGPLRAGRGEYFLTVGRLVPYKRIDLLIDVANKRRIPLKISGSGTEEGKLRRMAGPTVEFLGHVPDDKLPALYAGAKAFLFAAHEDAGVAPLEAQACGVPVIAYGKGGVIDTVKENETGIFFSEQNSIALGEALDRFERQTFHALKLREHARQFSAAHFRERIEAVVNATFSYDSLRG